MIIRKPLKKLSKFGGTQGRSIVLLFFKYIDCNETLKNADAEKLADELG